MDNIAGQLQATVKNLLQEEKVNLFLGYEQGTLPLRTRLRVVKKDSDAERLVWNALCLNSLATYLPPYFVKKRQLRKGETQTFPKVGIVAKGCDYRAIMLLTREYQILRDHVVIVGVPCRGMVDVQKMAVLTDYADVTGYTETEQGTITITLRAGQPMNIDREKVLADACQECVLPSPDGADVMLTGTPRKAASQRYTRVKQFEIQTAAERWQYVTQELSKCIRCNACRQACPTCYCKNCFADQTNPRWVGIGNRLADVMHFHFGRIMHQAGRCVECDACVRACPMGIDLRTLTLVMGRNVNELFDYVPGTSLTEVMPLLTYRTDEPQPFITEPNRLER